MATTDSIENFVNGIARNCYSGQIHEEEDATPIVTCHKCEAQSCISHGIPFHHGGTCAEYDKEREDEINQERASEAYINKRCKKCSDCGIAIQKISGCDHMTCKSHETRNIACRD